MMMMSMFNGAIASLASTQKKRMEITARICRRG
jgi:hypothetical protein